MTEDARALSSPSSLSQDHELDGFQSGVEALDEWLRRRARANEAGGGSPTIVLAAGRRVVGYYCLAAGSLIPSAATGQVRRNMPNPVPVILLGRLAIDRAWQNRGLGGDLLRDAVLRSLAAGGILGARAMLVHAISEEAKAFYQKHGFRSSPLDSMMLMITLLEAREILR